ncbi:MAG TPA: EAL domain-containing protein [Methylophilaceae bacterium]|nr:EAL domain-containing protein [Methylophilaceae bacterium]
MAHPSRIHPAFAGLVAAIVAAAILTVLDASERARIEQEQRVQVAQKLSEVRARFEGVLNSVLSSARGLAAALVANPGIKPDKLSGMLAELMLHNPTIRNIAIAEGTVIIQAYPREGNERIIGADYSRLPKQWPAYRRMMESGQAVVAGPVMLIQDELGVIVRVPVLNAQGGFLGSVALPIRLQQLLDDAGLAARRDSIGIALRTKPAAGYAQEVFYGKPALFAAEPVVEEVVLPGGGAWELAGYPSAGWGKVTQGLLMLRATGVAICLLAGLMTFSLMRNMRLRRENEQRLSESESRLRQRNLALSATSQGVLVADKSKIITYANDAASRLTGYARNELIGNSCSMLQGPETSPETVAEMRAMLNAEQAFNGEILNYRKDGTPFWNELSITPVFDAQQRISQFVGVLRDVTERRQAEDALRVAAIVFEAQEGMMVTDADTVIQRVNQSFTRITGYSAEEVIGKSPEFLKSGKHDAEFFRGMWGKIARDGYWQGEIWNRRKNGEIYLQWLTITAVASTQGAITHYVAGFFDITNIRDTEEKVRRLAFYDPLTLLPNRRLMIDRLSQALPASMRSNAYGAVLFIDLDDFKTLNDTRGHDVGDMLLVQVAQRLLGCVRETDTVSRFGGDEFVIMIENLGSDERTAAAQAELIGEKIRAELNQPYQLRDFEYHSSTSIGVCLFHGNELQIDELMKRADAAMYQSKRSGRNVLRFFDPAMQAVLEARIGMDADLRQALARQQLKLYYQMQVNRNGQVIGAEALIRWEHPQRGLVSPMEFIGLAEETGLILSIGQWVLDTACAQLKAWEVQEHAQHLQLSVNVSARQFRQQDFVDLVRRALESSGANPARLKLELTESIVLEDIAGSIAKMQEIKALGVSFSMDDFGTGYSSLAYLTQLPLDELKIDGSFVHNLGIKPTDAVIVQTIVAMADTLGIEVIAEGVETVAQQNFLGSIGCKLYQGYLYSKPVPLAEFERLLSAEWATD